ncbi:FHA domain-containing protein [Nannocystis sp. SCPEA4]|uniref:FHA domain-containing protein n=1 Tax=Nannocystis sp. SCPEA4 TaxID=2996787 RepID=UPI00226ECB3E|nr:FHA domain-containing protein [Nannocystis sp. SCPEA4]MCY1057136.1 FHA domain-containing protein [Nannocystis sp. SCPEA4]
MALRLIIEDEEGATTIVPLGEEEITIGREPGNTIQLTEQNVSRQHARLTPGSDGWVIEDLDSYNGVRVNGVLIEGTVNLNEGDVVQIGDYHLAITNNAEQTTLNIDRQGGGPGTDPMRAAPSMDLPRIPATEAAAMIAPPPQLSETPRDRDDERRTEPGSEGKGRGLLFALLAVFLIGGGFLAYQFTGGGGTTDAPKGTKVDPPAKIEEPPPQPVEQKTEPKAPEQPPPSDPPLPNDPVPEPTAAPSDPPVEPEPSEPTKKPVVPKGEKVVKPPPPPTKSEKPPVPKGDPVQLLEDARKANLAGNATQAYDLAKKSYDIDKNSNALALMGASACKMGDQAKAKSVFKKLTDPNRQKQMNSVCGERGIMLE